MTTFDQRRDAFEAKFAHDEELRFRALARRTRMLGTWAAGQLGLTGAEAETYAEALVTEDIKRKGEAEVFQKIRTDFDAAGVTQSDHQIHRHMDEYLAQAIAEVET
jgi:hypothetical protein